VLKIRQINAIATDLVKKLICQRWVTKNEKKTPIRRIRNYFCIDFTERANRLRLVPAELNRCAGPGRL